MVRRTLDDETEPEMVQSPSTSLLPSPSQFFIEPSERWIVVRKFEKRGGVRIKLPESLDDLIAVGSRELGIDAVCAREAATEGLLKSIDGVRDGTVVWLLTQEEEANFD